MSRPPGTSAALAAEVPGGRPTLPVLLAKGEEQAKDLVETWLKPMGLELKASKTQITHTLSPYQEQVGCDFLGWTVRQFPVGKTHTSMDR